MVILSEGLNKIRDLMNTALTIGQCGTGTSVTTEEDTGLDQAVSATQKTLSNNVADKLLTTSFTLNSSEGNGLSLTEFENQFSTGESLSRIRHTPITKDSTKELTFLITYSLKSE